VAHAPINVQELELIFLYFQDIKFMHPMELAWFTAGKNCSKFCLRGKVAAT